MDMLVIAFGVLTMLIRTVSQAYYRNEMKQLLKDIDKMARKQNVRWKGGGRKIGLITVLIEVSAFFSTDFLATPQSEMSNLWWYWYSYSSCFLVGFVENYYVFQLHSSLRLIFKALNHKVRKEGKKLQSTRESVANIDKHAKDHFDAVLLAKRTNDMFGYVLASWLALNFFSLVGDLNYSWLRIETMVVTEEFNLKAVTTAVWVVMVLANLVFLIGAWNSTAEEVCTECSKLGTFPRYLENNAI